MEEKQFPIPNSQFPTPNSPLPTPMKVQDIGEQGLLKILQRFCPQEVIGDDAAVLPILPDQSLVVTTDVLVDNVHFSETTTTAKDAGWRAAAANLSDLAAMGASPLGITVGLGLRSDVPVDWVQDLYQGMTECLQKYNTPIVGGDIVRSPVITISITAFGQVFPQRAIRRNQAKVGDAIVVTGVHGASRAGLELLLHPEKGKNLTEKEKQTLISAHQRPKPRLDILPLLWKVLNSINSINSTDSTDSTDSTPDYSFPISGMDSSDGLADALVQICHQSRVGAIIQLEKIPTPQSLEHWLQPDKILEYALYGGEDFELVLCMSKELADALVPQLENSAAVIGTITDDTNVVLRDKNCKFPDQVLNLSQGFQHFGS
jgi:thiamine-monophosphate kinase